MGSSRAWCGWGASCRSGLGPGASRVYVSAWTGESVLASEISKAATEDPELEGEAQC